MQNDANTSSARGREKLSSSIEVIIEGRVAQCRQELGGRCPPPVLTRILIGLSVISPDPAIWLEVAGSSRTDF